MPLFKVLFNNHKNNNLKKKSIFCLELFLKDKSFENVLHILKFIMLIKSSLKQQIRIFFIKFVFLKNTILRMAAITAYLTS
jgi:hypothetical protein